MGMILMDAIPRDPTQRYDIFRADVPVGEATELTWEEAVRLVLADQRTAELRRVIAAEERGRNEAGDWRLI